MPDDVIIVAHSYESVVAQMSQTKMCTPRSLKSYRKATAQRVWATSKLGVDPSTDRTFIKDLEKHNIIKRIA